MTILSHCAIEGDALKGALAMACDADAALIGANLGEKETQMGEVGQRLSHHYRATIEVQKVNI